MADWLVRGQLSPAKVLDMPPVWLAGFLGLVWLLARVLDDLATPSGLMRGIGAVLAAGGVALMVWALAAFRAHHTTIVPHQTPMRIITSGPFALSRNPIYLGDVMVLAGVVLWMDVWPALLLIPCFAMILKRRFIAPEEARMKQSFGADFQAYREKTRRWL